MAFSSGSISFRRFAVIGHAPDTIDQAMLDKLAEHALRPGELGVPEEVEYGWSGGRHILDGDFSFENNVFADALLFALRIDTNKVPGELKKAYQIIEEEAVAKTNPSGFISKSQKKDVKETIRAKVDDELRSGRYRRSKLIPILWDLPSGTLYCNASATSAEKLMEIFERTFRLDLQPISAGSLALRILQPKARRRDYEDLRPTRFVRGPEGEGQAPEYPWVAKGAEPKDFVGNEFVAWLWHEADERSGSVITDEGEVTIFFDRALDLDCAYGQTGRDTFRGDGVTRMPEALDALRSGKVPRKAGLLMDANNLQYSLNLHAESFSFGALKLPEVEDAENPRVLFEERIALLRDFCKTFDALFEVFLKTRASSSWEGQSGAMRKWIQHSSRGAAVAAVA
jgi:hypothetical protein